MIGIIDYQAGNLKSILNACRHLGYEAELMDAPSELDSREVKKIILPGVGNFGRSMQEISKFQDVIDDSIEKGKPFMGICLGIQVMLEESVEAPEVSGLGIFKGKNLRFQNRKVPHMGWNSIEKNKKSKLLKGIKDQEMFYFVHSFYPVPEDESIVAAYTEYGLKFPSVFEKNNVFATQFHPEKSGEEGLKLLKNFLDL